jgi:hypothetical protein
MPSATAIPSVWASDSGGPGVQIYPWSNPENAAASDDSYAVASSNPATAAANTYGLKGTTVGLSISPLARITGVRVTIDKRKLGAGNSSVEDILVSLVVGGARAGDNKKEAGVAWVFPEAQSVYGADGDTWGLALTRDQVVASDFGVWLNAVLISDVPNGFASTAQVDVMAITVYYTEERGPGKLGWFSPLLRRDGWF